MARSCGLREVENEEELYICKTCKGKGGIEVKNKISKVVVLGVCNKCFGRGYVDWVTAAMGVK